MRDWEDFFTAEDFDGSPTRRFCADRANAILREELKKVKRVYGHNGYYGPEDADVPDTHTALLINERPIDAK